jgi:catechol 2,3-dioxygenase-like lactoylglutathione lyase family enzyme
VGFALDHVQIAFPAGRENDADAFYVGVLGFTSVPKPPTLATRGGRWYERDGVQLHLGSDPSFVASAKAHVALRCDEYDSLRAALVTSGARVQDDDELEGVTRFYTWDPFGNRLEVMAG